MATGATEVLHALNLYGMSDQMTLDNSNASST